MNETLSLIESLSREMHDLHSEIRNGFERVEQATRRHSTAVTAGALSIGGLSKTVGRFEDQMRSRDAQIAELRDRVRLLEEKSA